MAATLKPDRHRAQKLKRNYGMSVDDYDKMLAKQRGKCLVCDRYRKLVVDHCHSGGQVRGLLCSDCNAALGFFRDSILSLKRAITYLTQKAPK